MVIYFSCLCPRLDAILFSKMSLYDVLGESAITTNIKYEYAGIGSESFRLRFFDNITGYFIK